MMAAHPMAEQYNCVDALLQLSANPDTLILRALFS